jgi:predicted MFS family arabinose efflux permease
LTTLHALSAFATLNHAMRTGSNVTVLLTALSLQASPVVVGTLVALTGVMPMLFAVTIGRLNDRLGPRLPMCVGSAISAASLLLPALWPGLPALYVATTLAGLGSAAFSVPAQNTAGHIGRPEDRTRNFTWISMAFSGGGILGPMIAGPVIDHFGHSAAFFLLAALTLPAAVAMAAGWVKLPPPRGASVSREGPRGKRLLDLMREPRMRAIYLLTALHVSAWEVFSFLVPVYGVGIGLAATSIGLILATFSAATFLVRLVMPLFARRFPAMRMIRASLVLAGVLFILFPLTTSVPLLMALAFVLGTGMGVTQPLAMTVLHEAAPEGRTGEAVGLRTAVVNLSGTTTPVIYGALGSALGMTPVFWGLAVAIWIALWALR